MIRDQYRNAAYYNRHYRSDSTTNTPPTTTKPQTTPTKAPKKNVDGNKYLSMFNAARSLGLTGAQFAKTLGILKKSGMLNKRTAAALQEVFLSGAKSGSISPKAAEKLKALGKEFSVMGKALTVLSGLFNTMMLVQKGKYPQAAAEIYKTAAGVAASGQTATINLINTALQAFYPDYKNSNLCKFVGAFDIVNLGGVAVDSIGTLFTAWDKNGADIKKLDGLVKRMRSAGAGAFVDAGENIYDIHQQISTSGKYAWRAYFPTWMLR